LHSNRVNIKYIVKTGTKDEDLCSEIAGELKEQRVSVKKTVIFCRTVNKCAQIFLLILKALGPDITEPPGLPVDDLKIKTCG